MTEKKKNAYKITSYSNQKDTEMTAYRIYRKRKEKVLFVKQNL